MVAMMAAVVPAGVTTSVPTTMTASSSATMTSIHACPRVGLRFILPGARCSEPRAGETHSGPAPDRIVQAGPSSCGGWLAYGWVSIPNAITNLRLLSRVVKEHFPHPKLQLQVAGDDVVCELTQADFSLLLADRRCSP
ncbi:hypothetical protein [Streptomyces sp. NBC_00557]|uniref:hypothetical protein n=1 Tax=Streptomyces sp. NBC_00557 TaxID=2975776 RepID=UPI002E802D40|nr:hypothetical protein [Streptomyces sp. NBC_00557]WUC39591.1 hypothetical protein OG956_38130 [Streptomyces sp. NBC_00557]